MRNSPAINLINRLIKVYSQVKIFDPINQSHNNIKLKKVKSTSFDMIIIFVKHDWLKKNKLKSKNIISL